MKTLSEILECIERIAQSLSVIHMFKDTSFNQLLEKLEPLIIQAIELELKQLLEPKGV